MKTILIVDDEIEICEILKDTFQSHYSVLCAQDGEIALSIIKRQKVDFVISDVNMPKMDGFSLLKNVRGIQPKLPFCIMSGGYHQQTLPQPFPANYFLEKPFESLGKIFSLVTSHFENSVTAS